MATIATTLPTLDDVTQDPNDPLWEPIERTIPMSYEEYLNWRGSQRHSEWVDGEALVLMPAPSLHADVTLFLGMLLRLFARRRNLGTVFVAPFQMRIEASSSAREPDVMFIKADNEHRIERVRLFGPADLAIEIVSHDSVGRDRGKKFDEYRRAGVGEYWIADPRPGPQRFDAWFLNIDGDFQPLLPDANGRVHSTVMDGFWLRTEWLWSEPLPDELACLEQILATTARRSEQD